MGASSTKPVLISDSYLEELKESALFDQNNLYNDESLQLSFEVKTKSDQPHHLIVHINDEVVGDYNYLRNNQNYETKTNIDISENTIVRKITFEFINDNGPNTDIFIRNVKLLRKSGNTKYDNSLIHNIEISNIYHDSNDTKTIDLREYIKNNSEAILSINGKYHIDVNPYLLYNHFVSLG